MTDDLLWMTSSQLIDRYRSGDVSPLDVARDLLRRVEDTQPAINAFVHIDTETSLAQARASEDRWRHREPAGLLDGVPVTIKDELDVAAWPTREGSRAFLKAPPAAADSPVVAPLRSSAPPCPLASSPRRAPLRSLHVPGIRPGGRAEIRPRRLHIMKAHPGSRP